MKIAFLGDIALFGKNTVTYRADWQEKFSYIKRMLNDCDFVIGNLETPLTTSSKTIGGKSAYIKGNPEDVEILNYLGVSSVSLANNHMFDYGKEGLDETIRTLESNGIKWYGAYGKSDSICICGEKIRLHGYCCYSANGRGLWNKESYINVLNPIDVDKNLETDNNNAFLSVVSFHFGDEHIHYPRHDHILLSRHFAKKNTIIMPCHHPHVIQGVERVNKSILAYSLGNFCFDDIYTNKSEKPLLELQTSNRTGIILVVEIKGNCPISYDIIPYCFSDDKYSEADDIFDSLNKWSDYLKTDALLYSTQRECELAKYINGRKNNRDFNWYKKRLNIESIRILLNGYRNKQLYKKLINGYIKEKGLV